MRVSLGPLVVPRNLGDKWTPFVRVRHNSYTTPTMPPVQHSVGNTISRSLTKIYYEDLVEFLKFNWFYNLLYNMRQNTLPYDFPIKNTHLQTDQKDPVTPYRGHKIRSTLKRIHKADQ